MSLCRVRGQGRAHGRFARCVRVVVGIAVGCAVVGGVDGPGATPQVWADAPAVTDFGQAFTWEPGDVTYAWQPERPWRQAMFLTLYADGRQQVAVRSVHADAVVSFAAEHPCWRLDNSLTWWFNLPVYVREVQGTSDERVL
jgi:hypothetical protein